MQIRTSAQFTLLGLFAGITALCMLLAAATLVGAGPVVGFPAIALLAALAACVWSAFFAIAPEAVKYGTVLGAILFMAACLLPMVLLQQRETSRRLQCQRNIWQMQRSGALSDRRYQFRSSVVTDDDFDGLP